MTDYVLWGLAFASVFVGGMLAGVWLLKTLLFRDQLREIRYGRSR